MHRALHSEATIRASAIHHRYATSPGEKEGQEFVESFVSHTTYLTARRAAGMRAMRYPVVNHCFNGATGRSSFDQAGTQASHKKAEPRNCDGSCAQWDNATAGHLLGETGLSNVRQGESKRRSAAEHYCEPT